MAKRKDHRKAKRMRPCADCEQPSPDRVCPRCRKRRSRAGKRDYQAEYCQNPTCRQELPTDRKGDRKYCDRACRQKAYRIREREKKQNEEREHAMQAERREYERTKIMYESDNPGRTINYEQYKYRKYNRQPEPAKPNLLSELPELPVMDYELAQFENMNQSNLFANFVALIVWLAVVGFMLGAGALVWLLIFASEDLTLGVLG